MENTQKLATMGTQDTGWRQTSKNQTECLYRTRNRHHNTELIAFGFLWSPEVIQIQTGKNEDNAKMMLKI